MEVFTKDEIFKDSEDVRQGWVTQVY